MRFKRALLGILAAILIAVVFTALGIFVGLRTQRASMSLSTVLARG